MTGYATAGSNSAPSIAAEDLAIRQSNGIKTHHLGTVPIAVAGDDNFVSRLDGVASPATTRKLIGAGPARLPGIGGAVLIFHLEVHLHVRIGKLEARRGTRQGDQLGAIEQPGVMSGQGARRQQDGQTR